MFSASILLFALTSQAAPLPSLAVFPLTVRSGVNQDTAVFMTDKLMERTRGSGKFSRVVGTAEIEQTISLEQQKQLLTCDTTGCFAEIAGALDVDLILHGNVGRVGDLYAVSLKIVDAHSSTSVATVTRTLDAASESILLTSMDAILDDLLAQLRGAAPSAVVEKPLPAPEQPQPPPQKDKEVTVTASGSAPITLRTVALVLAGLAAAATGVMAGFFVVTNVLGLVAALVQTRTSPPDATTPRSVLESATGGSLGLLVAAGLVAALAWVPVVVVDLCARVVGTDMGRLITQPWAFALASAVVLLALVFATLPAAIIAVIVFGAAGNDNVWSQRGGTATIGFLITATLMLPPVAGLFTIAGVLGGAALVDRTRHELAE